MKVQYHRCSHCGYYGFLHKETFKIEDSSLNFYCPECMNIDFAVELHSMNSMNMIELD